LCQSSFRSVLISSPPFTGAAPVNGGDDINTDLKDDWHNALREPHSVRPADEVVKSGGK